jgi:hypothetical protein
MAKIIGQPEPPDYNVLDIDLLGIWIQNLHKLIENFKRPIESEESEPVRILTEEALKEGMMMNLSNDRFGIETNYKK